MTTPLYPEIKQDLIKALRSGEYKKTEGQLRFGDCFCVLGVMCDLYVKRDIGSWDEDNKYVPPASVDTRYGAYGTMPPPFMLIELTGLDDAPRVIHQGKERTLNALNDYGDVTFEDIAHDLEFNLVTE